MAATDEAIAAAQDIHDLVFQTLHDQFPFMKSEAVDDIVNDLTKTALDKIHAQSV